MKRLFYLTLLLLAAGIMPTIDSAAAECQQWTATNDAHVAANRAYVETRGFGCSETTTYYAVGSDENLGTSGGTSSTLYSDDDGVSFHVGACPIVGTDADEDGYGADSDCDDNNPAIHPGAADICGDDIDQDCDGSDAVCSGEECQEWTAANSVHVTANRAYVENSSIGCIEITTYYAVGSEEEVGTSATETTTLYSNDGGKTYHVGACPVVGTDADNDGYASDVDCNDDDASIHPGATETCGDDIDQDCDGSDLACSGGTDNDQDGYTSDQDCDDENPGIHPGAMDFCEDGIDQDCSGEDSACLPPPSCITSLDNWKVKFAPQNANCKSCHTSCTPGGTSGRHGCTEGESWGSMTCTGCHRSIH